MGARGRGALVALPSTTTDRIQPVTKLSSLERAMWDRIVAAFPVDWFRPSDIPLLTAYVRAATTADQAAEAIAVQGVVITSPSGEQKVNPQLRVRDSQALLMSNLSARLRLCPSSRYTAERAQNASKRASSRPWENTA